VHGRGRHSLAEVILRALPLLLLLLLLLLDRVLLHLVEVRDRVGKGTGIGSGIGSGIGQG